MKTQLCHKSFIAVVLLLMLACVSPTNKEDFIQDFKGFIGNIEKNYDQYSLDEWQKSDIKFENFTGQWYDKFQDEFTINEKFKIEGLKLKYRYMRTASLWGVEIKNRMEKEDLDKIRKKVAYYIDNDMKEDIEKLLKHAKEIGDSAYVEVRRITKELNN